MNTQSTGENRPNSNQSDLSNFPALLTFEQAQQIEHNVCADANRLIMLGVLTNSSDQLKQNFMADDDSKEVLLETFELVTRFKESLKSLTELTDTAIARMAVISGVFEEVAEETSTNKKPA